MLENTWKKAWCFTWKIKCEQREGMLFVLLLSRTWVLKLGRNGILFPIPCFSWEKELAAIPVAVPSSVGSWKHCKGYETLSFFSAAGWANLRSLLHSPECPRRGYGSSVERTPRFIQFRPCSWGKMLPIKFNARSGDQSQVQSASMDLRGSQRGNIWLSIHN